MLEVKVNRKYWNRGNGCSRLLNRDGTMCILGFVAVAAGLSEEDIENASTLADALRAAYDCQDLTNRIPEILRPFFSFDYESIYLSNLHADVVCINDGEGLDSDKETQLTEVLAKGNLRPIFEG